MNLKNSVLQVFYKRERVATNIFHTNKVATTTTAKWPLFKQMINQSTVIKHQNFISCNYLSI